MSLKGLDPEAHALLVADAKFWIGIGGTEEARAASRAYLAKSEAKPPEPPKTCRDAAVPHRWYTERETLVCQDCGKMEVVGHAKPAPKPEPKRDEIEALLVPVCECVQMGCSACRANAENALRLYRAKMARIEKVLAGNPHGWSHNCDIAAALRGER